MWGLASLPRQVVKHQGAQHHVESSVRKRQAVRDGDLEINADSRLCCLPSRSGNHRRGGVNSADVTVLRTLTGCGDRQRARTAPHVEHCVPRLDSRQTDDPIEVDGGLSTAN